MENRNIDYDNIPPTELGGSLEHLQPPQATEACRVFEPFAPSRAGVISLVVVFCVFSLVIFWVVFGVLQARSNKRMCWYRHYQPVPMYYQDGKERVTLSKHDYEDEDSVSSV